MIESKISQIHVRKIDINTVREQALSSKQSWNDYQASMRGYWNENDVWSADKKTQIRWMVNYVRHELTRYDSDLWAMAGKVGCHEEYINYREAVLDSIAEVYPELKDECEIQKSRKWE